MVVIFTVWRGSGCGEKSEIPPADDAVLEELLVRGLEVMHDSTLAKRYASALADLAAKAESLEEVGDDLNGFLTMVNQTPGLRALLISPTVAKLEQHRVVDTFVEKAEAQPLTGNFLHVLVEKRRLEAIDGIVSSYDRTVADRSGRVTVSVASAKPLIKRHKDRIEALLSHQTGKAIQLESSTDPALLGGVVLRVGSVMMDYSVRGHLNRLKSQMRG